MKKSDLLFAITLVIIGCFTSASAEEMRIEMQDGVVTAYETLWTEKAPANFPKECLNEAAKKPGIAVKCAPTQTIISRGFNSQKFIMENVSKVAYYEVSVSKTDLNITETKPASKIIEKDQNITNILIIFIPFAIIIVTMFNLFNQITTPRLFIFYGAMIGSVVIGGLAGSMGIMNGDLSINMIPGLVIGGIISLVATAMAMGKDLNDFLMIIGGIAGLIMGILIGIVTSGLVAQYGWSDVCITSYLIFIIGICLASFFLRVVVAFFIRQKNAPE